MGYAPKGKSGGWTFYGCVSLESVYIPKGITSIGEHTFNACPSLTYVHIPEGVYGFGEEAFYGTGLTELELPSTLERIGKFAMPGKMTSWDLPDNVSYFWHISVSKVYVNEGSKTHVELLGGIDGGYMWASDYGGEIIFKGKVEKPYVPEIVIEDDVRYDLAEYSPIGTEYATRILIKYDEMGEVLDDSLAGNELAYSVYIEDGVTAIAPGAFKDCTNLMFVRLPKTLKTIGEEAFKNCTSLLNVRSMPEGVDIADNAFDGAYYQPE